ncbi:MAG TPA: YwqG family protein, partial [Flavobacterium sp.]|nr:YwqG family protein [Flavobacterium sp.]
LHIRNNPLKSLPAGIENIPGLDLELEKKMILLDYTYKGADNKGTIAYNDELFYARNDSDLNSSLQKAIKKADFQEYENGLSKIARHAVNFVTTTPDSYNELGNTRFGGLPDLPLNLEYPTVTIDEEKKGYQFIAQINCTSIADLQDYLPRTGILYFFIKDQEDFTPKVIYYDGETDHLKSAKELNFDEEFIYDEGGIYKPFKTDSAKCVSFPSFYNDEHYYENIAPELKELEEQYDETEALNEALLPFNEKSSHGINSYVFKQHDSPEIEAVNTLKGKPEEWMVLLRVSSDNNPGFCFWDAGEIYFVIHKSDLAKKDFSNVYCGLETS